MPLPKGLSFRSVYCSRLNLPRERFPRSVLFACLTSERKPVVFLLQLVRPQLFKLDYELAETVGKVTSMKEFENEVLLHFGGVRERSWLRDKAKLRISLHRLRKLALTYLPKD